MQPLASRHRVAVELRIAARKPRPMADIRILNRPIAHGLRGRGRRKIPLESGILSTSSESSSLLEAMTGTIDDSTDKVRGAFSIDPFCGLVGFQEEKLPDLRLRADCDLRSKLVRLLSEVLEGWRW